MMNRKKHYLQTFQYSQFIENCKKYYDSPYDEFAYKKKTPNENTIESSKDVTHIKKRKCTEGADGILFCFTPLFSNNTTLVNRNEFYSANKVTPIKKHKFIEAEGGFHCFTPLFLNNTTLAYRNEFYPSNEVAPIKKRKYTNNKYKVLYLYPSFLRYINHLSNNSLRLYLYFNYLKTDKGSYEFDIRKISTKFKVNTQTIYRSLKELEFFNLINFRRTTYKVGNRLNSLQNTSIEYPRRIMKKRRYKRKKNCQNKSSYTINLLPYSTDTVQILYKDKSISYDEWKYTIRTMHNFYIKLPFHFSYYWNNFKYLGSIKLYIYSCFNADYKKGYFFKSIDTIASELNVNPKTINFWFKDLMNHKLIDRYQLKFNGPSYTHIRPIGKLQGDLFKRSIIVSKTPISSNDKIDSSIKPKESD